MAPFDPGPRAEFINTSDGHVGAIRYKPNGEESAISVEPHGRVTLSAAEQELTAKSHRDPKKSPFLPQPYEKRDPITDEVLDEGERPLFEFAAASDQPWIPGVPGSTDPRPRVPADPGDRTAREQQLLDAGEAVIAEDEQEEDTEGVRDDREEVGTPTKGATRRRRRSTATAKA